MPENKANTALSKLGYAFRQKPLLFSGQAMDYYQLRPAGEDIDLIISPEDFQALAAQYSDKVKILTQKDRYLEIGDLELWHTLFGYDYDFYAQGCLELEKIRVIGLERLLFFKSLLAEYEKHFNDLLLIAKKIKEG